MKPGSSVPCRPSTVLSAVVAAEMTPWSMTTVRSSDNALPPNTLTLVMALASDILCFPSLFKQFRDMRDGLLHVLAQRLGSANRVVRLAGSKNLAMFRVETLCISRNVGRCIEMVVGERGIAQFLNHRKQPRTSPNPIQSQVELLIQLDIANGIGGGEHLIKNGNQWGSVLRLEVSSSFLSGQHLQRHPNFIMLDEILNGWQEHSDSPVVVDVYQAITLQQAKRLADGSRTDAEALRDLILTQPSACGELPGDDFLPQHSRNLLRNRGFCEDSCLTALFSMCRCVHTFCSLPLDKYIIHYA